MDVGVGSFVVANSLVSKQARNLATWSKALISTSPLLFIGFARLIFTKGVDYQVHVGEYGVHWNFFFTLAAISLLTSVIRIHPRYCGLVGVSVLAGYQICLNLGLSKYLTSHERGADIVSQNKEGIYSLLGYWSMYLIGVHLGHDLLFKKNIVSKAGTSRASTVKIWTLSALFWALAVIADKCVEKVSRRTINFAFVMFIFAQTFQVLAILSFAELCSCWRNLVLEEAFNQNMLGSFLLANVLTGLVNLSVDTLSASPASALIILVLYSLSLSAIAGAAHYHGIRIKFW